MARRKKQPLSVHREKIASAATSLFMKKGVASTTVDEIAKASGYSKATLYVYFENKEEIFFSLVYKHMKNLYETINHIVEQSPGTQEEWIAHYLEVCFCLQRICREYPVYFEGMIGNINTDITSDTTPQIYKDIYQVGLQLGETVKKMLEQGQKLRYLKTDLNAGEIMIFFWSALSGIIRMSEKKKVYYKLLGVDSDDFIKREFLLLLACCKQEENPLC